MNHSVADLYLLLRTMEPRLNPGVYTFVCTQDPEALKGIDVVAMVREPEGVSAVLLESDAVALGLSVMFRAEWITLTVQSDLQAVGLTAAFSKALGDAQISCNVVAGVWHDHIFVPAGRGEDALAVLRNLQKNS
ncbi:MAG: ACT domain-containing protein [Proteobacteria bacterium]|nr:ACT domain-containing protein [Pseudomonadota bacterium]